MSKPVIKYVEFDYGCTVTVASSQEIYRRHGTDHVRIIRNATEEDVAYVEAMGGPRLREEGRIERAKNE